MKSKTCSHCNSEKGAASYKGKIYCGKHRQQLYKHGKIRHRTLMDGNTFIDKNSHYEMIVYDKNLKEKCRVKIDRKDKEKIQNIGSWCAHKDGYVMNGKVKKTLHVFLLGKRKGLEIDHINGDKLDNRRENLRFINHSGNMKNWTSHRERALKQKVVEQIRNLLIEGKTIEEALGEIK